VTYRYTLIPVGPVIHVGGEPVAELTITTEECFAVGDVVPAAPGKWIVERVGAAGVTQWASEAASRDDPRTVAPSVRLYCRVEL
jgi:hypothetical protein